MTQEDKELLLQDLCGRLPYGVKMNHIANDEHSPNTLIGIDRDYVSLQSVGGYSYVPAEHYKPYLFPLSSMTKEQEEEYGKYYDIDLINGTKNLYDRLDGKNVLNGYPMYNHIYWLNKNHFYYRGLIPKSLAIDCTNLNIY